MIIYIYCTLGIYKLYLQHLNKSFTTRRLILRKYTVYSEYLVLIIYMYMFLVYLNNDFMWFSSIPVNSRDKQGLHTYRARSKEEPRNLCFVRKGLAGVQEWEIFKQADIPYSAVSWLERRYT